MKPRTKNESLHQWNYRDGLGRGSVSRKVKRYNKREMCRARRSTDNKIKREDLRDM